MILIRINLLKFSLQRLPLPRPRPLNFNGYLEIEKKSHYIISYSAVTRFLFSLFLRSKPYTQAKDSRSSP